MKGYHSSNAPASLASCGSEVSHHDQFHQSRNQSFDHASSAQSAGNRGFDTHVLTSIHGIPVRELVLKVPCDGFRLDIPPRLMRPGSAESEAATARSSEHLSFAEEIFLWVVEASKSKWCVEVTLGAFQTALIFVELELANATRNSSQPPTKSQHGKENHVLKGTKALSRVALAAVLISGKLAASSLWRWRHTSSSDCGTIVSQLLSIGSHGFSMEEIWDEEQNILGALKFAPPVASTWQTTEFLITVLRLEGVPTLRALCEQISMLVYLSHATGDLLTATEAAVGARNSPTERVMPNGQRIIGVAVLVVAVGLLSRSPIPKSLLWSIQRTCPVPSPQAIPLMADIITKLWVEHTYQ